MSNDFEDIFQRISSGVAFVERASGGPVPLPDPSGARRDHLFLNLIYADPGHPVIYTGSGDPAVGRQLLERMRDIAFDSLMLLIEKTSIDEFPTVVVSIFDIPREGENIRMYRTRIKTEFIPKLSRESLEKSVIGEESHHPEIEDALQGKGGQRT